jgi:hypothetical protein
MSLTSRRRRPLDRTIPHLRDTRLVVIATEGAVTEREYFALFQRMSTRVQLKVLHTEAGLSAPKHVMARLRTFRREYQLGPGDALCLVIDKDRWPDAQLTDVSQGAIKAGALLAVSNPCFELWLYLHFADPPPAAGSMTSQRLKSTLGAVAAQNAAAGSGAPRYEDHVDDAVRRAVALDARPADRWPNQLGTRVYRVIEAIRERC